MKEFNSDKGYIVTQANSLIEARYAATFREIRLILVMISMIEPNDEGFKEYIFTVNELYDLFGLTSNQKYDIIEQTLDRLMKRVIHIPLDDKDRGDFLKVHWLSSASYYCGKGTISVSFDPKLKPYLLNLKGQFTSQQLKILLGLSGMYPARIYQILKRYEYAGKFKIELNDFRQILGIEQGSYRDYRDLYKRIIAPAKKEFETIDSETGAYKSDLTFNLETKRERRKIKYLIFHIQHQKYLDPHDVELALEPEVIKQLVSYGIDKEEAYVFLQEQGEEELSRCVDLYEKRLDKGQVKNAGAGYLVTMIKQRAGQKSAQELEVEQKAVEKTKKQAKRKKQQDASKILKEIKEQVFRERKEAKLAEIETYPPAVLKVFEDMFLNTPDYSVFKLDKERTGKLSAAAMIVLKDFVARQLIEQEGEALYRACAEEKGFVYDALKNDI